MQNVNVFIKIPRDRLEVLIKRNLGGVFFCLFVFSFFKKIVARFFFLRKQNFFFSRKKNACPCVFANLPCLFG